MNSRRATLRIENRTGWRTDHLRAFVVRAREEVFGTERKPLRVVFYASRTRLHGRAYIGGTLSTIWLPPTIDRCVLAQILKHELAHNAGARGERWMRRGSHFGFRGAWRESVAWAETLPLELAEVKAKLPADPFAVLAKIASSERRWTTKAKRAATALKKLRRRRTYYERKLAATSAEER